MNIKKLLLTATASVLTVSSIIGCGAKMPPQTETVGDRVTHADPLAYKYGDEEKTQLASEGLFTDFENESIGTKYQNEDEGTVSSGIFSYRPKWSVFEVTSSEDGNALRYERGESSNAQSKDPHIDLELGGKIPAKTDFVAEFDIMPENNVTKAALMQIIYRPTSGRVVSTGLSLEGTELKVDGNTVASVPVDTFTKIACVMHQSEGTYDVYVNGYMVDYGIQYLKAADRGHTPTQVRVITSVTGVFSALFDNVAVYRGSEPKYISNVSESDIELLREYRFDSVEGEYKGENGLTLKPEKSTYNILKTPDGRSVLKNTVKGADLMSLSTEGAKKIRCFTAEVYLTSEETDYTLAAFRGESWTSVLEIRGTTLWNAIEEKAICELSLQKWAKIDLYIDGVKNICAIYVNGYRYVDGTAVSAEVLEKMDSIRIGATSTPAEEYSVYLDNVRFYNATAILGYKGNVLNGVETVYTLASPSDYSYVSSTVAGEMTVTDEVKGSGDTTVKLTGFTGRFEFSLAGSGLTKQSTGDYDLTGIDAIRFRLYSPANAGRSFVVLFDCGTVYRDSNGRDYYDGKWVENNGKFTCDKYPGVVATKATDNNGWSYFHYIATFDVNGWATFTLPATFFKGNRAPSWQHIEKIRIDCNGWNMEKNENETNVLPDNKAVYYLDTVELVVYG